MSSASDFIIENGILTKYVGTGGDVVIPEGVDSIGNSAFSGLYGLTSVTIPEGVTSIGNSAFSWCRRLTSVTIPDSVTSIDNCAFEGCSNLNAVYISDLAAWCEIKFGSFGANPLSNAHNLFLNGDLITDLVIPDIVTSIGHRAFSDCGSLTSVMISKGVKNIDYFAFSSCKNLKSVTIPENVTSIDFSAFYGCSSLTRVMIPNSVTSIGSGVFENCENITEICAPSSTHKHWRDEGFGLQAARGFINQPAAYTTPDIFAEYIAFISSQRKKLLPFVFDKDAVEILQMLAEAKKITKKNLEQDYLLPAMQCGSEKCIMFLEGIAESLAGRKKKDSPLSIKGRELWDGKHFSLDGKKLLQYPVTPGQQKYEVPEGTVEICASAFDTENGLLPEEVTIPKSVKWVRKEAFSLQSKATLLVRLPEGEAGITPGAFVVRGGARAYIVTSDQKLANELWNYGFIYAVYVGNLDDLTLKAKNHAVKGFLYASEHNAVDMCPWRTGYLAHIKRNQKTYVKEAQDNPYLLRLMLEEKLLSEKNVKDLLDALGGKAPEQTAALLDYQEAQFGTRKKKDVFSLSDDDPELKRMMKIAARREQVKGQKGIKGLVFVSTGDFNNFGIILGNEYSFEGKDMSDLKSYIEQRGGVYRSSVSSKTDYLICNDPDSDSVKSIKAKELGVPVITEEEFLKMADEKE